MRILSLCLIGLIALLHLYFAWFEIFAWVERGPRIFETLPAEIFEPTTGMAANQGLYNAFLSAGLLWSLLIKEQSWQRAVAIFFLGCVAVAGIFGGLTITSKIFFVQGVPAIVALALVVLQRPKTQ